MLFARRYKIRLVSTLSSHIRISSVSKNTEWNFLKAEVMRKIYEEEEIKKLQNDNGRMLTKKKCAKRSVS